MTKGYRLLIVLLLATLPAVDGQAQDVDSLILNHEVSAANFFGTNARAMAMGGSGIATAMDGSAMIYNPACLTRIRRQEIMGGISHLRLENTTDHRARPGYTLVRGRGERDLTKTHLDGLAVTVPTPTYRGSMVFAIGVHRLKSFDRSLRLDFAEVLPNGDSFAKSLTETESGGIYGWTAAGAIEVSPRVSLGGGLTFYTGTEKFNARYYREWRAVEDSALSGQLFIETDHLGIGGSVGLLYQVNPQLALAAVVETPSFWSIERAAEDRGVWTFSEWEDEPYYDADNVEYSIRHPFSLGLGAGYTHQNLQLALDLKYTDWSQMEYTDPFSEDLNAVIQELYKEVVAVNLGAEYTFPEPGISLRAGYFSDPLPFPSDRITENRQYFTFGLGFLIDRVMTVDLAAVLGGHTLNYQNPPHTESYDTRRIFLTVAYRL